MKNFMRRAILSDLGFYTLLVLIISISSVINYNANKMGGMVHRYCQFSDFIVSGFSNYDSVLKGDVTFPMWGYSFIFAITKSKLLIIIFQQIITFFTILFIDFSIKKFNWSNNSRFLFRLLILLSLNWFFFHTSLWPNSISANLLLLSLFFLLHFFRTDKKIFLILSGVTFGFLLNFRSDYYYYVFFLFTLILFLRVIKKLSFCITRFMVWIIIIITMLVPWGVYSLIITNHFLQTTTNGGHVLFISLGQLPNNNWQITPSDDDYHMKRILLEEFSLPISSLNYQADIFLKKKWFEYIKKNPNEFLKKNLFQIYQIIRSPFYVGDVGRNYFTQEEHEYLRKEIKENLNDFNLINLIRLFLHGKNKILLLPLLINIWGITIFCLCIFLQLRYFIQKRVLVLSDPFFIIYSSIIFYQLALMTLSFFMPSYNTNIYVIYITQIVYLISRKNLDNNS